MTPEGADPSRGLLGVVSGVALAIPLTSIIAIVRGSFAPTRPFAVLLAEDVGRYEGPHDTAA